jgi:hypothetical protein
VQRALLRAIPFAVAIPIAYGATFVALGQPVDGRALLVGAAGWFVALLLRSPVGLAAMALKRSEDETTRWVVASSGPLEEGVRLVALLLFGRDLTTALWLGLGWASIEIVYTIINGFALASLANRNDPEAERVRALLPPSAFTAAGVAWGVVERAWASAVHVGFTLITAAAPIAVILTAPLHSAINITFVAAMRRYSMAALHLAGAALAAGLVGLGLALHAALG